MAQEEAWEVPVVEWVVGVALGFLVVVAVVGAPSAEPESVVMDYLAGNLVTGANVCDH